MNYVFVIDLSAAPS